ncbi:alpha/beta fold hydrolase [Amycolatopsis japonica]
MCEHRQLLVNGISMHVAEEGDGPLIVLLHGFPESWYSWRHQLTPLAQAGYRVVAPDQRGYGDSDRPADTDDYSIFHLVGDVVALIERLGANQAVVVGHDWGALVAWQTALMRPDLVRGVVGLSVPPLERGDIPPISAAREARGDDFYQIYFQEPGVADAELDRDPGASLRRILSAVREPTAAEGAVPTGPGFLDRMPETANGLPAWLRPEDLKVFTEQFRETGFTGGLNWYRNLDRNWTLTAPWSGARITAPALFITGDRDPVRETYPISGHSLDRYVPNLKGVEEVADCGHWVQQERPDEVTALLLGFLGKL